LAEAARLEPGNPMRHVVLGIALGKEGLPEQAEASFRRALQADPRCVPAILQLSSIRASCDRPELRDRPEAVRLAQQACELTGRQDPGPLMVLAVAHHEAGQKTEAISTAEQALKIARATGNQTVVEALEKRLHAWRSDSGTRE
jgi:cytochrome c-type biogenesis protein CcmH/NrfG